MTKRKATKRTQRKARGRGADTGEGPSTTHPQGRPKSVSRQNPGVTITYWDGTSISFIPPGK